MFTGLIEELGRVVSLRRGPNSAELVIAGEVIFSDLKTGDSVAVNGVCLTAKNIGHKQFTADVMHESLKRTNLGVLGPGSAVNLERAMAADGRFGGHIVCGHIDGVGTITAVQGDDIATIYRISAAPQQLKYIIEKGSVAIDGISLTVVDVDEGSFSVSLIPHTAVQTTLGLKKAGDSVNLECDSIGKYVEKLLGLSSEKKSEGSLTLGFLEKAGF